MVVRHGGQLGNGHTLGHGDDDLVDQFAAHRPGAGAAENFARLWIAQQFHEAVRCLHDDRLAVVVEWVARGLVRDAPRLGRLFGEADGGDLRVGEHDADQQPILHRARVGGVQHVVRGGFALLDGDVHNLVRAGAVAPGEDVRRAGSHLRVAEDATFVRLDTGVLEGERGGVGRAAQPVKNRLGAHLMPCAVLLVDDHFVVAVLPRVDERAAGVDGDALVAEGGLDRAGDVVVKGAQNIRATLEHGHRDVEPREELGELDRHRAAAEHDDRLWQRLEPQGVVARHAAELGQAGQRQVGNPRAGGDHDLPSGDRLAVVQLERVRVAELGQGAN